MTISRGMIRQDNRLVCIPAAAYRAEHVTGILALATLPGVVYLAGKRMLSQVRRSMVSSSSCQSTRLYRSLPCVGTGQVRIQGASQEPAGPATKSALCVAR